MNRLERMLKDFDENQLREINKFLNSADGRRLKSHINSTDKDKLLQEFSKLDPNKKKNIGTQYGWFNEDYEKFIRGEWNGGRNGYTQKYIGWWRGRQN